MLPSGAVLLFGLIVGLNFGFLIGAWWASRKTRKVFPRNVVITSGQTFEGDWVAIPREDFDEARS